jgi:hypothetical protein
MQYEFLPLTRQLRGGKLVPVPGFQFWMDLSRPESASIMPRVVTGNLNAPILMMAEKISDRIRGRQPLPPSDAPYHVNRRGARGV